MSMKIQSLILATCFALQSLPIFAQTQTAACQLDAEKFAKALMANDNAKVLAFTHERIVAVMGGPEGARAALQKSTDELKAKGLGIDDTKIGAPQPPQKIGTWMVCLVPETLSLRMPGAKLQQESFLLGISTDEGKTWKFIDLGPLSEEKLFTVFPELKGLFKMPAKKPPVVEKIP